MHITTLHARLEGSMNALKKWLLVTKLALPSAASHAQFIPVED